MSRRLLLFLFAAFLASAARADLSITAEADKTSAVLNDQIGLTVTVTGTGVSLPDPQLPALPDFSVYSAGTSQSFSFINGQASSSKQYTYVLTPHAQGKLTIGPITVGDGGKTAQSQPIDIMVGAPGQAPPPAAPARVAAAAAVGRPEGRTPDLFVSAEVDKKKAYVNEQVTLVVKFYTSVNLLGNPQYNPPATSGFLTEDLQAERHGTTSIRGRNYYFSEIRTALFPTQAGRLTVGPATVRCQVQTEAAADPFSPDFFQRFFQGGGMGAQTRDLHSDPLILDVSPLPEAGKPPKFSGAVGRFTVSASADRASAKVGDAVALTVTVDGAGNLKAIGAPDLPSMPDFRAYDTVTATNLEKKNGVIAGAKTFKTVLVPRVSGDLTIPAVAFDYFDPSARAYRSVSTSPIRLKVAPGEAGGGGINFAQAGGATAPGLSAVSQDIRYLKTARARAPVSSALSALASAGWLNSLPLLLFLGTLGADQYEKLENLDPRKRRRKAALKNALKRVEQARAEASPKQAAELLSEALSHYLADKLNQPALGLTLKRVLELMPALSEPARERLRSVWRELEALQFAPAVAGGGESGPAAALEQLLQDLEKEAGR